MAPIMARMERKLASDLIDLANKIRVSEQWFWISHLKSLLSAVRKSALCPEALVILHPDTEKVAWCQAPELDFWIPDVPFAARWVASLYTSSASSLLPIA